MANNIVWKDLPERYGLFTKRSTTMVSLDDGTIIVHYGANTKINFVQETIVNGERYFRTETAKKRGLNWAVRASSFSLPEQDKAPLEPSERPRRTLSYTNSIKSNKNAPKRAETPENGEVISANRKSKLISAFKRFLRRR